MAGFDEALRLLKKAAEDEYVLDNLAADPQAPESVLGFHAQQAAEKLLKALLFVRGIAPPRTHQLALLLDLARDAGVQLPEGADDLRGLVPYAVLYRYDEAEESDAEAGMDRRRVRESILRLRLYVESLLAE